MASGWRNGDWEKGTGCWPSAGATKGKSAKPQKPTVLSTCMMYQWLEKIFSSVLW